MSIAAQQISLYSPFDSPNFIRAQPLSKNDMAAVKKQLIKQVAIASLVDFSISMAFTGATCAFVASPIGIATLIGATVTLVGLNILFRTISAHCLYLCLKTQGSHPFNEYGWKLSRKIYQITQFLAPTSFSLVTSYAAVPLIHEGSHALAAKALFKNANSKINIRPFSHATTTFQTSELTKLGSHFGKPMSKLIVAGAGTAGVVATASLGIGIAHLFRKKSPELSLSLLCASISSIATHTFYALSALWKKAASHDFVFLRAGGFHPLLAVISIVAIPLAVKGIFCAIDYAISRKKPHKAIIFKKDGRQSSVAISQ